jgi:hypothetical protein
MTAVSGELEADWWVPQRQAMLVLNFQREGMPRRRICGRGVRSISGDKSSRSVLPSRTFLLNLLNAVLLIWYRNSLFLRGSYGTR